MNDDTTYINIHGSCLSKDVFSFLDKEAIKVRKYFARSSIISAVSKPTNISMDEINLQSKFQKAMVYSDINKTIFKEIKENKSDYLMIDLIDERFDLIKTDNGYITNSCEFRNSNLNEIIKGQLISRFKLDDEFIKKFIDKYAKNILEIYKEDEIIIHEVYNSKKYLDKNGNIVSFNEDILMNSEKSNELYEFYYKCLKQKIPNAHLIDISREYFASESHIWSLAPYHFEDRYYLQVLKEINNIIQKNRI